MTGKCSIKTDVYAYGVFLLELVSGKDVFSITSDPARRSWAWTEWVSAPNPL